MGGLALLAAGWQQVKAVFDRLRSLLVTRVRLEGDAAHSVHAFLAENYRRSPFGDRYYRSTAAHVRPLNRMAEVAWEITPGTPLIFWREGAWWSPVLLGAASLPEAHHAAGEVSFRQIDITAPRWVDVEAMLIEALEWSRERKRSQSGRFCVRHIAGREESAMNSSPGGRVSSSPPCEELTGLERFLQWKREDIGAATVADPMGALSLSPGLESAVEEFHRWRQSAEWYRSKGIPWRRGWLLHGRPGTGKTSLARALAQCADMPVFHYDLASLTNVEFVNAWREMQPSAPCMALIEDIDAVFQGRENVVKAGMDRAPLSFDCLLNALGGMETADGVFIVVTTNHIGAVDEALSRPGRLDSIIEVPALALAQHEAIVRRILGDWPDEWTAVLDGWETATAAQMTERCVTVALKRYWEGRATPPSPS